jgi:hypothetical protein
LLFAIGTKLMIVITEFAVPIRGISS